MIRQTEEALKGLLFNKYLWFIYGFCGRILKNAAYEKIGKLFLHFTRKEHL
jgi:hypothetical protein